MPRQLGLTDERRTVWIRHIFCLFKTVKPNDVNKTNVEQGVLFLMFCGVLEAFSGENELRHDAHKHTHTRTGGSRLLLTYYLFDFSGTATPQET